MALIKSCLQSMSANWIESIVPNDGDMSFMPFDGGASGFPTPTSNTVTTSGSGVILANAKNKTSLVTGANSSIICIASDGTVTVSYSGQSTVNVASYDFIVIVYSGAGTFTLS